MTEQPTEPTEAVHAAEGSSVEGGATDGFPADGDSADGDSADGDSADEASADEASAEGFEPVRSSKTTVVAAVGVVVALALATSGITLAGLSGDATADAPAAAAPAWLTPPGVGGPGTVAPMPGGAPAVPAMMADPSAPAAPPTLAAAVAEEVVPDGGAAAPDAGSDMGASSGDAIVPAPSAPAPLGAPPMAAPPLPAKPMTNQASLPVAPPLPVTPPLPGANSGAPGTGSVSPPAGKPSTSTTIPTSTTTVPTTTPTAPACTPSRPLTMAFTYDGQGRVTSVVISGLRPDCGPVTVVLNLAGSPAVTEPKPVTSAGTVQVVLPTPLPPTAVGAARVTRQNRVPTPNVATSSDAAPNARPRLAGQPLVTRTSGAVAPPVAGGAQLPRRGATGS